MSYEKFNLFIKNYIENDKTGRAVMLTSGWGTGKSYYINNNLKPFLESVEGGKHDCVIVSLYGLTDISDISKSIYLKLRTIGKSDNTEVKSTGKTVAKIVGKTIFNGIISKIGFDIGEVDDNDLQKVYESIDLSRKLIILDDLERSGIDRVDLLGYINNLCEQDGVKVLIITNESELIQTKEIMDKDQKIAKVYTDETLVYLKAKEKTIGDTINFVCDYNEAVKSIVDLFNDPDLSRFSECAVSKEIAKVYYGHHLYKNLRAFMQTCQKSYDIFKFMRYRGITVKDEIKDVIFYGLMGFINRMVKGEIPGFPSNQYVSSELGYSDKYPLFKFCYDYVVWQILDENEVRRANKIYMEYFLKGKWSSGKDSDLLVIKNCYQCAESDVISAIENVRQKFIKNEIPYHDYGIIINYLVHIKYEIGIDFDLSIIEERSLMNLKGKGNSIRYNDLFSISLTLFDENSIVDFNDYKNKVLESLKESIVSEELSYKIENVDKFCDEMQKIKSEQLKINGYIKNIDIDKFINLIKRCPSKHIDEIRLSFLYLYNQKSREQINIDDITALRDIYECMDELKSYEQFDKIQKYQVSIFAEQLQNILNQIS